jgi:hypothetical protein
MRWARLSSLSLELLTAPLYTKRETRLFPYIRKCDTDGRIIYIMVFVYDCTKVFNRLASGQYLFLTLEIQLIRTSTSQMELSLDSSR